MVKHLAKFHGVSDKSQGEVISDKWKYTLAKKAWSCGFCIHTFSNFQDRLKHLQGHFEQSQTLKDWDLTKVIQGLLLQPGLRDAWNAKLALLPAGERPEIIWKESSVKDLQYRLEIGPVGDDGADTLAEEAYVVCVFAWGSWSGF